MAVYQWLLKLYPASFREEYGAPMERQFRDDYRDARSTLERWNVWLSAIGDLMVWAPSQFGREFALDAKHAIRQYAKHKVTTLLAVIALGLSMGLSTGVFSVLNALLIRSLPFSRPEQLAELWLSPFTAFKGRAGFDEWARSNPYLEDATTFSSSDMNLERGRDGFRVKVAETSANFFSVLGVQAVLGRTFVPDEDVFGRDNTAVISFGLWQQLFGGSDDAKGKILHINGAAFTIGGVMPASFDYPAKTNVWLPTVFDFEKTPKRGAFLFQTIGRLKEGITVKKARSLFEAEVRHSSPNAFDRTAITGEENLPRLASLQDQLAGPVRQASWVLAGLTLLVLATACAGVAQLLLSRTMDRRGELELRAALGASAARLLQQLITEALLLTAAGAVVGLGVAVWAAKISYAFAPAQLSTQQYTVIDWHVIAFAVAVTLVSGVILGCLPVWALGRLRPSEQTACTRVGIAHGPKRARMALVTLQTGFALCLVAGSFAMGRTFLQLLNADLGFRPQNVLTLNVSVEGTALRGIAVQEYYKEALSRLRSVPGVQAAGAVSYLPLASNIYMANSFVLNSGQKVERVVTNAVSAGYFRAMRTQFLAGGDFAESATQNSPPSVIVNEDFARATGLGTNNILGRRVLAPWNQRTYAVTGVVTNTTLGRQSDAGGPQIFWRIEEEPAAALTLVARVQGPPEEFLLRCRDAVRSIDPAVPVYDVQTLDQRLEVALARPRFYTTATIFLAVLALLLALLGCYGTAAYSIAQRTHEMGVRLAVGASYSRVRAMLLREEVLPILFGTGAGLAFSWAAGRYLEELLINSSRTMNWASAVSGLFLLLTGACAVWSASSRILKIDPAEALRTE